MAHTVCPMTKRKRWKEELYGTPCVCRTVCDQRSAAAPRQGRALDVEQKTCTMCGIFCHSQSRCTALTEDKKKCLSILREDIKCPRA